jgi:transcriptional regulator with XRE-family HTH domain
MADELAARIGEAARRARKALDLTQADVAERMDISVEFYARIERGHQVPSVPTLANLMRLLGLSFDDVVLGPRARAAAIRHEPTDVYDLGSPEQRRLYRRLRDAPPVLLRLLTEEIVSFDRALSAATTQRRARTRNLGRG